MLIPAWNEAPRVGLAVADALALGRDAAGGASDSISPVVIGVEVIVADGGSDDATAQAARDAGAHVVHAARGRGRQLRAAADFATGDVVLMLHADARLTPEAGVQIAAAFEDPQVAVGAFRQRIDSAAPLPLARIDPYRWIERGNAFRARGLALPYGDQGIFLRRALLDAVGGVPDLPLMEDVALMQHLARTRWRGRRPRPVLLDGPITVSARRWRRHGVVRQTLRNWALLAAFLAGVPAERLVRRYPPETCDP